MTIRILSGHTIILSICLSFQALVSSAQSTSLEPAISWFQCLDQEPGFYSSDQAIRIADNVMLYQRNTGGWPSNINMAFELTDEQKEQIIADKSKANSLLDNGATHTQIRYLTRVYNATKLDRFKQAALKGLDYLFDAQYDNGGWPQIYPNPTGYHKYITFNDDAMVGALSILYEIAEGKPEYGFVDPQRRQKAEESAPKGIECILKCQVRVNGRLTAWCQQYDNETLEPRSARKFEPISLSTRETIGIVKFLMSIDKPSPEIIKAIQAAADWLNQVKINSIRQIRKITYGDQRRLDRVIIEDENAQPIWARLYEIGTNRPVFGDRDGKVYYAMSEISLERREGYAWYGYWPKDLLAEDYPAWQKKLLPNENLGKNR
jgi:PelA/Pel-15E family pectate lyase